MPTAIVRRVLREFEAAVLDLVAPPTCPACGTDAAGPCAACAATLEMRDHAAPCPRCGAARRGVDARCDEPTRPNHADLIGIAALVAPFGYRGAAGAAVRRLKFAQDVTAGRWLATAMARSTRGAAVLDEVGPRTVVVGVPLHRRRRAARGFDQAALLARWLADARGWTFRPSVLRRVRATAPQGDPRVRSRSRNVAGAFAVVRPGAVNGRAIVLVDDVVTSASTVRECARVLRQAGAERVVVVAACVAARSTAAERRGRARADIASR